MTHTKIILAAVAALTLATTATAFADPGFAKGTVNVRTGPGTGYAKVGTLPGGEEVDIKQCQGSWCYVDRYNGADGWVSSSYLAFADNGPSKPDIPVNFGMTVGPNGPSFSFGIGDAPAVNIPAPQPAPVAPEVCFYKNMGFSGAEQCVAAGTVKQQLPPSWNDKISSIKLIGGAQIQVCKDFWSGGQCGVITQSKPNLGSYNDAVSSYQTW